jgi:hypothetical protein
MKTIKNITFAAAVLAAFGSAHAADVYISGATAYRSAANVAIAKLCGDSSVSSSTAQASVASLKAYCTNNGTTAVTKLGDVIRGRFEYVVGGVTNNIHVSWSGSEAGIQNTAGGNDGTASAKTAGFYTVAQSGALADTDAADQHATHMCYSDTAQGASIFSGTKAGDGVNYATLTGVKLGVVGFTYFVNTNTYNAGLTNMTIDLAKVLLANGKANFSSFTGRTSDTNGQVYLVGRNIDSGTRVTTLLDMSYGSQTKVKQYLSPDTNTIYLSPTEVINGISSSQAGNSGYASGGSIAAALANPLVTGTNLITSTNGTSKSTFTGNHYLVGYISGADLSGKAGVQYTTFNGVDFNTTNIINGTYSFWSYEYAYYNPSRTNSISAAVYNALVSAATNSSTDTAKRLVKLTDMKSTRTGDGATVTSLY